MHQLPPQPDSFRVKIWRKLQRAGAVPLKNSVYVLPDLGPARKSLEAIISEIQAGGGEAFLCDARFLQGVEPAKLVRQFNEERNKGFQGVLEEARALLPLLTAGAPSAERAMKVAHALGRLRRQLDELVEIDFFGASLRPRTEELLSELESRSKKVDVRSRAGRIERRRARDYQGRIWVTRPGLHVDRLASAWLIRRFIDEGARFKFVDPGGYRKRKGEVLFDVVGGDFTHVGDLCTFEVLVEAFALRSPALRPIAEIIHDIDLDDQKYQREETRGIAMVIQGLVKSERNDARRIERAGVLFDELHSSLAGSRS